MNLDCTAQLATTENLLFLLFKEIQIFLLTVYLWTLSISLWHNAISKLTILERSPRWPGLEH